MTEGSIDSSPTSTSQTLTNPNSIMATNGTSSAETNAYQVFLECLQRDQRHRFLRPAATLPEASLGFVKETLEGFAGTVSDEQHALVRELNKKRRKVEGGAGLEVLKVRKVHVTGLETGQVWQQANKIIERSLEFSETLLRELEEKEEIVIPGKEDDEEASSDEAEDADSEEAESSEDDGQFPDEFNGLDEEEKAEEDIEAGSDEEMADVDGMDEEEEEEEEETGEYTEDPFGLNDGFFDIEEFNRQTQLLEQADARGEVLDDSDEEPIDWNADPFAAPAKKDKKNKKEASNDQEDDESSEEEEDDGPTFGNVDLFAPEGASEDEGDNEDADMADLDNETEFNANGIYFKDFFAPPPRKRDPNDKRPRKKPAPIQEEDVDRAMMNVKRDLFEDLSEDSAMSEDERDQLSDADAGDPKSRRSAHERRQAKLAEEIRQLETAAVEKRKWTLIGEATAAERPANSLLEEDLDFEYVGKPVAMITPAVTEGIEEMIKRRILAREFDEVIRRRPGVDDGPAKRGLVEIDDTKSKKGLAELYEEDHIKEQNPDTYVSEADSKLAKEEAEVVGLWKNVVARLDALSSWHYKPKPTESSLTIVSDVATIAMEDAMPTTAAGVTADSAIAPQEVYSASNKTAEAGDVVTKGGMPLAKAEMSREDKQRMRRRAKERGSKRAGNADSEKKMGKRKREEEEAVGVLRKGGAKVINRKGEVVDVDGNKIKGGKVMSSGNYKL